MNKVSLVFIPLLVILTIVYAAIKKKNAYASFLNGTKEGLALFVEVFPSVMAMLLAVTMLEASGLITDIKTSLKTLFPAINMFADITPMVLFRPISGSASIAVLDNICAAGADSFTCKMASTIQGSTDTTIYVLSLYFTSVGITKWKHALKVGLMADVVGITVGVILSLLFLK